LCIKQDGEYLNIHTIHTIKEQIKYFAKLKPWLNVTGELVGVHFSGADPNPKLIVAPKPRITRGVRGHVWKIFEI
jgi:hypothetical protein